MSPVQFAQFLCCQKSQPKKERQSGFLFVLLETSGGFDKRLLNYVPRVNSTPQARIHAESDHARQPVALEHQQVTERLQITRHRTLKKF
jgi:hypothetical protein